MRVPWVMGHIGHRSRVRWVTRVVSDPFPAPDYVSCSVSRRLQFELLELSVKIKISFVFFAYITKTK